MKKRFFYKTLLLAGFMLLYSWGMAVAQTITVKGKVTIPEAPSGMQGVSVTVKGTTVGTTTDANGMYHLSGLKPSATLVFSHVGYSSVEQEVKGRTEINVILEADASTLDQVVVIGYGTARKKDLTGAISSIKATQLENEHPSSVQDILRANVPGLNIGFSASPKGDAGLQIRGKNTLNAGSSPLIVLDGTIYYGALADINPNDIETVDVLKDASAAAVYGAKAASGVIQVTTKKGKSDKPTINFNASSGLATMGVHQRVNNPEEFLRWREDVKYSTNINAKPYQYGDPRKLPSNISITDWLAYDNANPEADPVVIWLQRLNLQPVEIENYKKGQTQNWYDMVFQNGLRQDYNLSLSGRKEGLTYYWSLGYMDNEGIVVGDKYNVIRTRINLDAKVTKFLSVGTNTQFSVRDESAVPVDWGVITSNSPWGSFWNNDSSDYRYIPNDEASGGRNPFSVPKYTNRLKRYYTLNSNIYAKAALPFGIKYQLNFTPRFEWYNYFNGESSKYQDWANIGGRATRENQFVYQWQIDNLLTWNKDIQQHHVDVTLLANAEKFQSYNNSMTNSGFSPSDVLSYHNIGAGNNPVISSNDQYSTGDALMGRLFYSFKDRYMLTATVRRDGYSAFGQSNPRATFPSAALGWVFTDESFIKTNWLNYGKLRLSYGRNGNRDIGRYVALSDLNTGKYLHVLPNGSIDLVSQLYVNNMSNKLLKWETTTAFNIGLDFSLFNSRIDGSIEAYKSKTTDLLVQRRLPDILGFNFVYDNLGQVNNQGIELNLSSSNIQRENFNWITSINFSLNRNQVARLYGDMVDIKDESGKIIGQKEADDETNKWFIGRALDAIWDQRAIGIWQMQEAELAAKYGVYPGDFKVKDVNGDGKYTNADREFLGFTEPRFRWTLRNEFSFNRSFTFSFMMYSYWGHLAGYNQAKNRSNAFPDRVNSYVLPYWKQDNPINDYARLASSDGSASYSVYRKKSFIRLDNIAFAYNVPKKISQKISVEDLKFYFTIKNAAFYASEWNFWDPENSGPTPRIYTLGINLTL